MSGLKNYLKYATKKNCFNYLTKKKMFSNFAKLIFYFAQENPLNQRIFAKSLE